MTELVVNCLFLSQPMRGIGRFSVEISKSLRNKYPNALFVAPNRVIHKRIASELNVYSFGSSNIHIWEQISLPRFLIKSGNPLLLNLTNSSPFLYQNKIITIHDVVSLRYPEWFNWKHKLQYNFGSHINARFARAILTVSKFSKNEIASLLNIDRKKIFVVYNSIPKLFKDNHASKKDVNTPENYVLSVSGIETRKNFVNLAKAFLELDIADLKLVIIGKFEKDNYYSQIVNELNRLDDRWREKVIFTGFVDDQELSEYYKNANLFVFPSLYEGFGMPPLEAMYYKCPVISSNRSSMPEILSDSALFFDPTDISDLKNKMQRGLREEELRTDLIQKGMENVRRFNWEKSAIKVTEVIECYI